MTKLCGIGSLKIITKISHHHIMHYKLRKITGTFSDWKLELWPKILLGHLLNL
jgi:hypothetical protein